ncbi:LacI family DNA-binding transcriptional regulator (plasmid) [Pseudomonas luteola]|uniref:LacI family DNA-binding transcriptional regulator n=1 Tax=Pseudomonas luteola TaxID=47886 RepID=UPI003DA17D43
MSDISRRPVTAHDVARLAGVSQSAVSRTFTPGASVSAKTREKVETAAASLGYRPNLVARSLITRRSNLVAVVLPSMVNPFYAVLLEHLATGFELLGMRVLLFSTASDEDSDPVLEEVMRHRVDAIVLVSTSLSSRFAEECRQTGLAVVQVNRRSDSSLVSSVTSNNTEGGQQIAEFMLAAGLTRLAFIAGRESSSTSRDREQGFSAAVTGQGLKPPVRACGYYDFIRAQEATRELLGQCTRPEGIFCANDLMAIAALDVAVKEFGLHPGRDISIIGYDDIPQASWPLIGLTTWSQPLVEMASHTVELIRRQLQDPAVEHVQIVLNGKLIVRSTT